MRTVNIKNSESAEKTSTNHEYEYEYYVLKKALKSEDPLKLSFLFNYSKLRVHLKVLAVD